MVFTQDFYLTSGEEVQLGTGASATVFRVDPLTGKLTLDPSLPPFTAIFRRDDDNTLFETFAR